jgi:NADPH-dependent 2,4-dienoyl-CoA reductase/sulfur reductase-like enzyme
MGDSATTSDKFSDAHPPSELPNGRLRDEYYKPYPRDYFAPKTGHQSLDIAIIGAGIAGLLTAVALAQSGHNVEVVPSYTTNQ